MISRKLLNEAGYLREDFGLYGYEDMEWGHRAYKVCQENDWKSFVIPGQIPRDVGMLDPAEYTKAKAEEVKDPKKEELFRKCASENWPYYNPFSHSEIDRKGGLSGN